MNEAIRQMLTKPGRHYVGNTAFPVTGRHAMVEVTKAGECYQLTPDGKRDGLLRSDGWEDEAIEIYL